ncbi:hypothetical protein Taro_043921 [Colocasia esculenta]|uniref:Aspartate racemase n=1 Tax=Colocasia esculenta TaxID=4460 RepID=A0A843WKL1_COLES|nr:hypothetical protein [Colocasia esculenta]
MFDGSMAMRFQASSCLLQLVGGVNSGGAHLKTRSFATAAASSSCSSFSARPSSLLLPIEKKGVSESRCGDLGSSPMGGASSSPAFAQANTVGVIGGVSAGCTLNFLENLVGWSSKEGQESLPFIVCSDPVLSRELPSQRWGASYSSQTAIRNSCSRLDRAGLVENLRHKRVFLERSGARCIVMPCHVSHFWYREVSDGCSVPFFHLGECVAKELKSANLRPVEAGSNVRIGVLATDTTVAAGFYQDELKNLGFEVVLPDKATMEHTVIPAVEALNRKDMEGATTLLRIAMQVLLVRAVNRIILASHDMRGLLPSDDPLLKKCIDPMDALARSTIEWAKSTKIMHTST